jgi:hypothetical protein
MSNNVMYRKIIEYPKEVHEKLVDLLCAEIQRTHAQKSMTELIAEILKAHVTVMDPEIRQARAEHAKALIAKAEKVLPSPYNTQPIYQHWIGQLEQLKAVGEEELNAQLDALIARFKRKVK